MNSKCTFLSRFQNFSIKYPRRPTCYNVLLDSHTEVSAQWNILPRTSWLLSEVVSARYKDVLEGR